MTVVAQSLKGRIHYAWIVVAVIFLTLLAGAGVRAPPSVMIVPMEEGFGWSRATISAAIAVNILLYGLMGPFAAAAMQRIGIRRTVMLALALLAATIAVSTLITRPWQLMLTWGLFVGTGTGVIAIVLGATVVSRWFAQRRGLAMGILTASTATGQLVFLPGLAAIAESSGWRPVALVVAATTAAIIPIIALLLPERPRDLGLPLYGADEIEPTQTGPQVNPIVAAFSTLKRASASRDFWLLFASFFVCGLSTNGLIGTHLIAACLDHGIPEVSAAGLLAVMGIFDLVGTTASGWLSDRYDSRWLLFWYYGLRGLSLIYLPYSGYDFYGLSVFAVFYGLDWLATVPPTSRLTTDIFGKEQAAIVFGWITAGHQLGAATAALGAGIIRTYFDAYLGAFIISGIACVIAAFLVLLITHGSPTLRPQAA